jgi:hypothetical protein
MDPWESLNRAVRTMNPVGPALRRRLLNAENRNRQRKTRLFPTERLFCLSADLSSLLTDSRDRILLSRRVRGFLLSRRRGRLRLPKYLPAEVQALSELSKTQLRERVYWVKPSTSSTHRLLNRVDRYARQLITGGIWNRRSATDRHTANVVGTSRLRKTEWPRIAGSRWPSTPTLSELLEMSRRGIVYRGLEPRTRHPVENRLTRQLVSDDIRVATKIVSKYIVGIRSSEDVPRKFLKYFRYRWNFLVLTVRWAIPAGLVRFLLSRWVCAPTSLWLVKNCRFKNFLKLHTADEFTTHRQRVEDDTETVYHSSPRGVGSPPAETFMFDMEDFADEMGDEFMEFCRQLPS